MYSRHIDVLDSRINKNWRSETENIPNVPNEEVVELGFVQKVIQKVLTVDTCMI